MSRGRLGLNAQETIPKLQHNTVTSFLYMGLTVNKLSCVVEEIGHQDPVNNHGSYERHHGEDQAGPLTKLAKVVSANIREFPVGRVYVGWTKKRHKAVSIPSGQSETYCL